MSSSPKKKESKHYHHGDLRPALIASARLSLKKTGVDKLSLRAVASQLGVSHAAAYHHFKDKNELIEALAEAAFSDLEASLNPIFERKMSDSEARLRALANAYIEFALTNPEEFRLMYLPQLRHDNEMTKVEKAGRKSYELLLKAVKDLSENQSFCQTSTEQMAITLWGLIHGLASLMLDGPLYRNARTKEGRDQLVSSAVSQMLYGLIER